jgi:hypothetical protein
MITHKLGQIDLLPLSFFIVALIKHQIANVLDGVYHPEVDVFFVDDGR